MTTRILVFLKAPEMGQVKTRLAKTIGRKKALALYRHFAEDVISAAQKSAHPMELHHCPAAPLFEKKIRGWLGNRHPLFPQKGKDLGEKMAHAFKTAFESGAERAVLIGTDCPGISPHTLTRAFALLHKKEMVFGPANDGGYYLVGLTRPVLGKAPFREIPWSTPLVMEKTLEKCMENNISWEMVEKAIDIDTIEDLRLLIQEIAQHKITAPKTERFLKKNDTLLP